MYRTEQRDARACTHGSAPAAACHSCFYYMRVFNEVRARMRERQRERRAAKRRRAEGWQ